MDASFIFTVFKKKKLNMQHTLISFHKSTWGALSFTPCTCVCSAQHNFVLHLWHTPEMWHPPTVPSSCYGKRCLKWEDANNQPRQLQGHTPLRYPDGDGTGSTQEHLKGNRMKELICQNKTIFSQLVNTRQHVVSEGYGSTWHLVNTVYLRLSS